MKIKVKKKRDRILVKVKFSSTDQISQRELDILSRGSRDFLLPKKLRRKTIIYSGKQGISLNRFLKTPLTRYEFYFIMAQIADITRKIESNELFLHNIILDLRYVFINQTTKELQFLYLPILSNHVCVDVRGFMESVIYAATFDQNGGTDYVAQFADFLRNMPQFSSDVICDYIQKREKNIVNRIGRGSQSGFFTDKPADYYSHYGVPEDSNTEDTCLLQNEETTLLNEDGGAGEANDDLEETVLLDDEATTLLQDNDAPQKENPAQENRYPYLIRVSANEKISLCKPVFRLGKEKDSVDYFVYGNNAVSRAHADIVTRGNRCFVIDCNSTNKTYINDREIPPKIETEIHDGDILKLANEAFEFHLS